MECIRSARLLFFLFALSIVSIVSARTTTDVGAYVDSSSNMMTASSLPNSSYLRASWRNSGNTSKWVKDFAAPSGYTFGNQQLIKEVGTSGVFYVATTINNISTGNQEYEVLELSSTGTLTASAVYSTPSGTLAYLTGLFLGYLNTPYLVVNNYNGTTYASSSYIAQYSTDLSTVTSSSIASDMFADDAVMDSSYNIYISGSQPGIDSNPYNLCIVKYTTEESSTAGLWYQWQNINDPAFTLTPVPGEGCLTLDSSGNLTYVSTLTDSSGGYHCYAYQTTTSSGVGWSTNFTMTEGTYASSSVVDSSGNIYATLVGSSSGYQVVKFTVSGTHSWTTTASVSGYSATSIALDASGDLMVAVCPTASTLGEWLVQRYHNTGVFDVSYSHTPTAGNAGVRVVFPTSTAGYFFGYGTGFSSSTLYPECYFAEGSTIVWGSIETTTT